MLIFLYLYATVLRGIINMGRTMKIFSVEKTLKSKNYYLFGWRFLRLSGYSNRYIYEGVQNVFDYIRFCTDLEKLPPAHGIMRKRQLGMLKILRTVADFCKQHNIQFWLEYGTLLGAIRHKGFIPWDDDTDIGMMREDYEKFVELFNRETPDRDLYAEYYSDKNNIYNLIKIYHKNVPNIWLDIFPNDFGYKKFTLDEAIERTREINKYLAKYQNKNKKVKDRTKLQEFFKKATQQLDFVAHKPEQKPETVFYGLEYYHADTDVCIFDYDMFFPLKTVMFEGIEFPCVNKPELYLTYLYKDYMSLPKNFSMHIDTSAFDLHSILALEKYIEE